MQHPPVAARWFYQGKLDGKGSDLSGPRCSSPGGTICLHKDAAATECVNYEKLTQETNEKNSYFNLNHLVLICFDGIN